MRMHMCMHMRTAKGEGRGRELRASEAEGHDDARDGMSCNDLRWVARERWLVM